MGEEALARRLTPSLAMLAAKISGWEAGHPTATLVEMEAALDAAWSAARAELLGNWANAQPEARVAHRPAQERPICPACGVALVADGRRQRTVRLDGDQALTLEREYARCPTCGSGLFPPG
jgi:YgiT-type zinc finger domain-containing protein